MRRTPIVEPPVQDNFWTELKERKVFRVLFGYAVACFVVVQVIDAVGEPLGLSNQTVRILLGAMFAIVPLVAFLAWTFERSDKGLKLEDRSRFGVGLLLATSLSVLAGFAAWQFVESYETAQPIQVNATAEMHRIAVLPFTNIVPDTSQEYFVDGMTDTLITELAGLKNLRVTSRASVMRYRETDKTIPQIAEELDVGIVLEGSVQRIDDTVSISAKLIDAVADENIWARRYSEPLENVLQLQARVALDIVQEIDVVLTPNERQQLTTASRIDKGALDAYLRGRHFWEQRTYPSFQRALAYFDEAVVLYPKYAAAHSAIADTYGLMGIYEYANPRASFARMRTAATTALAFNPELGAPHVALAMYFDFVERDWAQAHASYLRGRELNPQDPNLHIFHAVHLLGVGDLQEAEQAIEAALQLDPLMPLAATFQVQLNYYQGNYEQAISIGKRALEFHPDFPATLWHLGEAYLAAEKNEDAARTFERIATLTRRHPLFLGHLGHAYVRLGRLDEAKAVMEEIREKTQERDLEAGRLARIYVALGEHDRAIDALIESLPAAQRQILDLGRGPKWDPLRSHPRFQALLSDLDFVASP